MVPLCATFVRSVVVWYGVEENVQFGAAPPFTAYSESVSVPDEDEKAS